MSQSSSRESELQNILRDERDRCNQYKQIYQTLKEKHAKLQEELSLIHEQLRDAISRNEQIKTSNESYVRKLEGRVKEKQSEINTLTEKIKSLDPKKVRETVLEESSKHYEARIKEAHAEVDRIRENYNSLHYEHAILKCKFDSRESEYSHSLERIKLQHLTEIEQLQSKIELLDKNKSHAPDSYALELKSAKREVLELNSKLKVVLSECEELRAQNENLTLQINSINRTHTKQIADNMNNIRSLESEKQRIAMQKEVFEKELENYQEQRRILNNEVQSNRREIFTLRNKLEECEHKCHVITTNLQVETERCRSEKESEREQLSDEISKLKAELRSVSSELTQAHQIMMSKEQEFQQTLLSAKQQLWKQSKEIHQEKNKIEQKLRELEENRNHPISQLNNELQTVKQNLHLCSESKFELEKELSAMKEKLKETLSSTDAAAAYENASMQKTGYAEEIRELKEKINYLASTNRELIDQKEHFMKELASGQKSENYLENGQEILQLKLSWEQQKLQFHQRLEDLESQLKESKNSSAAEKRELEFKIRQYSKLITKLRERHELQKIQNQELLTEKEILEKNVPYEIHLQVKNQLADLQRRIEEYRLIVSSEPSFLRNIAAAPVAHTLLTDIKNLKESMLLSNVGAGSSMRVEKNKVDEKVLLPKKGIRPRRRSFKNRAKEHFTKKVGSPIISSSSDLELENL